MEINGIRSWDVVKKNNLFLLNRSNFLNFNKIIIINYYYYNKKINCNSSSYFKLNKLIY